MTVATTTTILAVRVQLKHVLSGESGYGCQRLWKNKANTAPFVSVCPVGLPVLSILYDAMYL